jgi:hypothetical protein
MLKYCKTIMNNPIVEYPSDWVWKKLGIGYVKDLEACFESLVKQDFIII